MDRAAGRERRAWSKIISGMPSMPTVTREQALLWVRDWDALNPRARGTRLGCPVM